MLSFLRNIFDAITCLVSIIFECIAYGMVWFLDILIQGLATVISGILVLDPSMPNLPALPGPVSSTLGWVAWFWPVGTTFDVITFLITAYLAWLIVGMVLRWARVVS